VKKLGVVALAVLPLLLTACNRGGDDTPPPTLPATINIRGNVTVRGPNYVRGSLSECAGAGAYTDYYKGGVVTVSNRQGRPLAIGRIQYGVGTNVYQNRLDECTFNFFVPSVPRAGTYQIAVGRLAPMLTTFKGLLSRNGLFETIVPTPTTSTTTPLLLPPVTPGGPAVR
jgi:hypothetical protein